MSEGYSEVGRFDFGKNGKVILSKSAEPITYYKIHWFLYTWAACLASAGKGCAVILKAKLSLDRAPPKLRDPPQSLKPPPPPPGKSSAAEVVAPVTAFQRWLTTPPPSEAAPRPAPAEPPIPPFDLQDIPDVMDRTSLPVSAKMMRRWFAGQSNYSRTKDDVRKAIDQDGRPFPDNMIDRSIIKLEWVLGFPRAKAALDDLIAKAIYAPKAMVELQKQLRLFTECRENPFAAFDGLRANGGDVHRLHETLQFQRVDVDATWLEKSIQWLAGDAGTVRAPDDLTGALGSFSFYAAVGTVFFNHVTRVAKLDSIYVYVRDSYSFRDDDGSFSQYLGHWSGKGVYLAPTPKLGQEKGLSWMNAPLVEVGKSVYEKGAVMYPVTNKSFRDWRMKHGQGGDFITYTKPKLVGLGGDFYVSLK